MVYTTYPGFIVCSIDILGHQMSSSVGQSGILTFFPVTQKETQSAAFQVKKFLVFRISKLCNFIFSCSRKMCVPFTNCTGPLAATSHCDGGGFYGNSTTLQYPICNNQGVGHGQSLAKKFDVASCARRFWSGYWAALKGVNV